MSADLMGPVHKKVMLRANQEVCLLVQDPENADLDLWIFLVHGLLMECLPSYGTALAGELNI